MPKASKKVEQSSSFSSNELGPTAHKTKQPSSKATKKRKDSGTTKKHTLSKKELKELEKQRRQKAYVPPIKPQPIKQDPLDSTGLAYVLPGELVIVLRNLGKKAVKTRERALDELDAEWVSNDRGKGKEVQEQILIDMLPVWLSHLPQLLLHASRRIRLAAANVHRSFVNISAVHEPLKLQLETDNSESADVIGVWVLAAHDVDPAVANMAAESWRKFAGPSASLSKEQITSCAQRAILDPGGLYAYINPAPPPPPAYTPTPTHHVKQQMNHKVQVNQKSARGKAPPTKGRHTSSSVKVSTESHDIKQPPAFDELPSDVLETDTDRDARIRVGGLGALAWVLSSFSSSEITSNSSSILEVLTDVTLWSSLAGHDDKFFGFEQPSVRKAAWRLVGAVGGLLGAFKSTLSKSTVNQSSANEKVSRFLRVLSSSVFHGAWNEKDTSVQGVMWQPLLRFLKDNPEAWQWDLEYTAFQFEDSRRTKELDTGSDPGFGSDSDSNSSDDEDVGVREKGHNAPFISRAYKSFLSFLASGCNGSPIQAYPAVVVILSTIPSRILLSSYPSQSQSSHSNVFADLFSSFWAPVEPDHFFSNPSDGSISATNRIFSGLGAEKASKAFVETVLECLVFLIRRIVSQSRNANSEMSVDMLGLSTLVRAQINRVWEEVTGIATTKDAKGNSSAKKPVLRMSPDALGAAMTRVLHGLRGIQLEGHFYNDVWETVTQLIRDCADNIVGVSTITSSIAQDLSSFVSGVLKALQSESTDPMDSEARRFLVEVFDIALGGCERSLIRFDGPTSDGLGGLYLLTKLIYTFGLDNAISSGSDNIDYSAVARIDTLVVQNAYRLLSFPPNGEGNEEEANRPDGKEGLELLVSYLLCRDPIRTSQSTESSQAALLWLALLEQVVERHLTQSGSLQVKFAADISRLLSLLDSLKLRRGGMEVIAKLRPVTTEFDDMVLGFVQETVASGSSPSNLNLVRDLLLLLYPTNSADNFSHPLLTPTSFVRQIGMLVAQFKDDVEGLLGIRTRDGNETEDQEQDKNKILDTLDRSDRLLVLMEVILRLPLVIVVDLEWSKLATLPPMYLLPSILSSVFLLAHTLSRCSLTFQTDSTVDNETVSHSRDILCARAQQIWESSVKLVNEANDEDRKNDSLLAHISTTYTFIMQSLRTVLSNTDRRCPYWCTPEDLVQIFDVLRSSMLVKTLRDPLDPIGPKMNPLDALLPSQESYDALLNKLNGAPISRSLGVVDELAGVAPLFGSSFISTTNNAHTYGRYTLALLRIISDDLGLARGLFAAGSSSWWILRHLLVLGVYAQGVVMVPNAPNAHERNPLSIIGVGQFDLVRRCTEIVGKIYGIVAYVFASAESTEGAEGRGWRKDVGQVLIASTDTSVSTFPPLAVFFLSIIRFAAQTDNYRDCCVLREVLSRVFQGGFGSGGISEEESNLWLNFARRLSEPEKGKSAKAPLTGITVMSALVENLPPSSSSPTSAASISFPRLDRFRNELASSLLGVPPSRATSDGLRILLRLVLGTAPDAESEAEFLPVQRAVNVVKVCQNWIEEADDEDESVDEEMTGSGDGMEELESAMTLTFFHLAPILQNVPGGHWQFIFDVVENSIENFDFKFVKTSSVSPPSSPLQLITLARTLRLISHIQDLAATNKSLRAEWNGRKGGIIKGIKNMILVNGDAADEESDSNKKDDDGMKTSDGLRSVPENVCRELVLELVAKHLSDELMDHQTFPKMCHLLSSSSVSSIMSFPSSHPYSFSSSSSLASMIHHDQLAYQILHRSAKKRTEHFVLEAGVDTEGKVEAKLPEELIVLLQQSVNLDIDVEDTNLFNDREHDLFVYLLGWMLLFDSFEDTSMKVRMRYIEQLRSSSIIEANFIPSIFSLLSLDRGIVRAYKLDMWAVDEFYVQFYEAGSSSGLRTLAAHLYYRALLTVPSLIYNWVLNCRDRQLSSTIASYTQSHFSPVLIRTELEHVKSPEAQAELASSDENQLIVKVSSGAVNEVTASYLVDEQQLEIRLRIPGDWPLHRIEIRDTKKVGVDDNRWRAWILGVQQTIWAQNGRIVDGLALFKRNVTGHFEGQVECAICYSLINVTDGSLPKKPCNTCKNRFHAGCLFKWFNSSHSSSCPLCRSDILH